MWESKALISKVTYDTGESYYQVLDCFGQTWNLDRVSNILSETIDSQKKQGLQRWKDRVGAEEAERVKLAATTTGTEMHRMIEDILVGKEVPEDHTNSNFTTYINNVDLSKYKPLLIEAPVYWIDYVHSKGFGGTVDAVLQDLTTGEIVVTDHKSTGKIRADSYYTDYKYQISAYWNALENLYNVEINRADINIASPEGFKCVRLSRQELQEYWNKFYIERFKKYYGI